MHGFHHKRSPWNTDVGAPEEVVEMIQTGYWSTSEKKIKGEDIIEKKV